MGRFASSTGMANRTSRRCYSVEASRSSSPDLMFYEGEDIRPLPLKERRAILDKVTRRYGIQKSEMVVGCAMKLYETVCDMDLEGIVLKKLKDPYDAERTPWWKVLNAGYSRKADRAELFERRAG
jgi:ATP-dependent DNA ligase